MREPHQNSKVFNPLKTAKGFTLAEVLVTAAIAGIMALGSMSLIVSLNKNSNQVSYSTAAENLREEIRSMMSTPASCTASFQNLAATTAANHNITQLRRAQPSGAPVVEYTTTATGDANVYMDRAIRLTAMRLTGYTQGPIATQGSMRLVLTLDPVKEVVGSQRLERTVMINVNRNGANNLTSCEAVSAGDDTIWQRVPANLSHIFFNPTTPGTARVGIGTNAPTNFFHLLSPAGAFRNDAQIMMSLDGGDPDSGYIATDTNGFVRIAGTVGAGLGAHDNANNTFHEGLRIHRNAGQTRLGVNIATPIAGAEFVFNNRTGANNDFYLSSTQNTNDIPLLVFRRARGTRPIDTAAAESNLASGDWIGGIYGTALTAGTHSTTSWIQMRYLGDGSSLDSEMRFGTTNDLSMTLNSDGNLIANRALRLSGGAPNGTDDSTNGLAFVNNGDTGIFNFGPSTATNGDVSVYSNNVRVAYFNSAPPSGSHVFHVFGAAGNTTGTWDVASDRRLKKDIKKLTNALETVLKLSGVSFRWKEKERDQAQGEVMGFIAQDVEKVLPSWVLKGKDGTRTLRKIGVEALLVEAIKEVYQFAQSSSEKLLKSIEQLSKELGLLTARVEVVEANDKKLESRLKKIEDENEKLRKENKQLLKKIDDFEEKLNRLLKEKR